MVKGYIDKIQIRGASLHLHPLEGILPLHSCLVEAVQQLALLLLGFVVLWSDSVLRSSVR